MLHRANSCKLDANTSQLVIDVDTAIPLPGRYHNDVYSANKFKRQKKNFLKYYIRRLLISEVNFTSSELLELLPERETHSDGNVRISKTVKTGHFIKSHKLG